MRNRLSMMAGLALLAAAAFGSGNAEAMTLAAPAALKDAASAVNLAETVNCRSVWRCGYYGCGWRQVCWSSDPFYDGPPAYYHRSYSYYGPPRPYYYGPPRPYYDGPPRPFYRPYGPPPWVSGPYFIGRSYYY